jgi:large subunit ribosomal protein L9
LNIEVVLIDNDPKLGKRGQIIKVSTGYAQNYLFPNKKALPATPENLKNFEAQKAKDARFQAERLAAAKDAAAKIEKAQITISMLTGEGDKLYGAVTSQDIQAALREQGIQIERKDIHLDETIRRLGTHPVTLRLHPEVTAALKVSVVKKG